MIPCQAIIYIALSEDADSCFILTVCVCVYVCDSISACKKRFELKKRLLRSIYLCV